MYSLSSMPNNSISAPARFTLDGIIFIPSTTVSTILSLIEHSSSINSYTVFSSSFLFTPNPLVIFPCGSRSIVKTFFPASAKQEARLIAVVVLPTPPFWLAIAIILLIIILISFFIGFIIALIYMHFYKKMFHVKHFVYFYF